MSSPSGASVEATMRELGDEGCQKLLEMCHQRKRFYEIADELGIDRKKVSGVARALGYERSQEETLELAHETRENARKARRAALGPDGLWGDRLPTADVVRLYQGGMSMSEITRQYGLQQYMIIEMLNSAGVSLRPLPITFKQILSDLNSAGYSNQDVANEYTGTREEFHHWVMSVVGYEVTKRSTHKIVRHLGAKRRHQPRRGLLSELRPDIFAQLVNSADTANIIDTLTTGSNRRLEWRCDECSGQWTATVYDRTRDDGRSTGCPNCAASLGEKELAEWVASLGYQMIRNDHRLIAPNELDIIITELGVALEFNGEYWHSAEKLEKTGRSPVEYHSMKRDRCAMRDVTLGFVWETDWRARRDEVKAELLALFDGAAPGPLLSRLESDR